MEKMGRNGGMDGYHKYPFIKLNMGVSKNNGTSNSSILIGFSIINHPFWGTPIFGNTQICFIPPKKWLMDDLMCKLSGHRTHLHQAPAVQNTPAVPKLTRGWMLELSRWQVGGWFGKNMKLPFVEPPEKVMNIRNTLEDHEERGNGICRVFVAFVWLAIMIHPGT